MDYEKMWNELKSSIISATHNTPEENIHPIVKKTTIQVFQNVISKMESIEKDYK